MSPTWHERSTPRPVTGMLVRGTVAQGFAEGLLKRKDLPWRGASGRGWLCLLGEELPWVDGALWLGTDPEAPSLLMPTLYQPEIHPALLEQRVHRRFSHPSGPYVLVPPVCGGPLLLALGESRPLAPEKLRAWLGL